MNENAIHRLLNTLQDGQFVRVTTKSGRMLQGIYNAEDTSLDGGLHWETEEGNPMFAKWENLEDADYRNPRASAGRMMVPPEHPLSGQGPVGTTPEGLPFRPHTTRN